MLSTSHNRAYQDFLTLLTACSNILCHSAVPANQAQIQQEFRQLIQWFQENIVNLDSQELNREIAPRWQSIQTEIKREFKLLKTDLVFLAAARQQSTQSERIKQIQQRISRLSGYCRGMMGQEPESKLK